jgi:hypothetical protein
MSDNSDYQKNKDKAVIDKALKITAVLDLHLSEEHCNHTLKEILREVFEY